MNIVNYILIIIGAVLVYGSGLVLKQLKKENSVKAIIITKFLGLGIALIGIIRIFM